MASSKGIVAEDYVKAIYAHTEWHDDPMTTSALAARLGLAPSSVTEMVRKLGVSGLVGHERYGSIELTAAGRALALNVVRRHRLIETWLVNQHGYDWSEVHDEAEVLEHSISDRLLDSLERQLGYPIADPHGDPIPTVDGRVTVPDTVELASVSVGAQVAIVRISDRDATLLRALAARSVLVGSRLTIVRKADAAGSIGVVVAGEPVELDRPAVAAIRVTPAAVDTAAAER